MTESFWIGIGIAALLLFVGTMGYVVWSHDRINRKVRSFLGVRSRDGVYTHKGNLFQNCLEVDLRRAMRDGLPEMGLASEARGLSGIRVAHDKNVGIPINLAGLINGLYAEDYGPRSHAIHKIGPGKTDSLPTLCVYEVTKGRFPVLISIERENFDKGCAFHAAVADSPEAQAWLAELIEGLEKWAREYSVYRRQALSPLFNPYDASGTQIEFLELDPGDLELDARIDLELDENFMSFIRLHDILEPVGIRSHRGVLLCGEPGTGKTTTCRHLRKALPEHTFVIVGAGGMSAINQVFEFARRLEPSVIVFEDVDLLISGREELVGPNPSLQSLLNEMDGLQARDRTAVILTSNSWAFIEKALGDRPGRIDHKIFFDRPTPAHRGSLLGSFLEKIACEIPHEELISLTDELTPSQLREVINLATVLTMKDPDATGAPRCSRESLICAVERIRDRKSAHGKKRIVGLQAR